eukprot:4510145-Pyramimonas_sp.AAC.1
MLDDPPLLVHFSHLFGEYVEIPQPDFTHRTRIGDVVHSVARLNRVYWNVPTGEALDWHARSGTIGVAHDLSTPSDHVPVYVQLSSGGVRAPSLPRWVTEHPEFGTITDAILMEVGLPADPLEALRDVKGAMYAAKDALTRRMFLYGARTNKEVIAVCLRLMRMHRCGKHSFTRACCDAVPDLRRFYDDARHIFVDYVGFHNFLAEKNSDMLMDALLEISPQSALPKKCASLHRHDDPACSRLHA